VLSRCFSTQKIGVDSCSFEQKLKKEFLLALYSFIRLIIGVCGARAFAQAQDKVCGRGTLIVCTRDNGKQVGS
jgi:hypothetical protein